MNTGATELRQAQHPIVGMLAMAVPLWAVDLCKMPIEAIFEAKLLEALQERIGNAGEAILYRVPGKSADGFNALAETIARLAFCPGGVRTMGMHFEYKACTMKGRDVISHWREGKHGVPIAPAAARKAHESPAEASPVDIVAKVRQRLGKAIIRWDEPDAG